MTKVGIVMSFPRLLVAFLATIGLLISAPAASAAPVPANTTFIATPNGQVGVTQQIIVKAPRAQFNKVITLTFATPGLPTNAGQTTVNAQGFATLPWTPPAAGQWTITTTGLPAQSASTTISVTPMPTSIVLDTPNQVGVGRTTTLLAEVSARGGVAAPSGTVTVRNQTGQIVAAGALTTSQGITSSANLAWTPAAGTASLTATFTPATGAFGSSVSVPEVPTVTTEPIVALRFPPVLYVGVPVTLQAVQSSIIPPGWGASAAFNIYSEGALVFGSGSQPVVNGVASFTWTPPQVGVITIEAQYSTGNFVFDGTSQQVVNVQPAPSNDSITVTTAGAGLPASLQAGNNIPLAGSSVSGADVTFSATGPCVINASVLTVLSAGSCEINAFSPGGGTLQPVTVSNTITITAAPRPQRPRR